MSSTWLKLTLAIAGICFAGCRSMVDYQAAELPTELRSLSVPSPRQIDLTAIARQAINQDIVYPGDILEVSLATGLEEQEPQRWPLRVSDKGDIDVPLVGRVRVVGHGLIEAERLIREVSIEREIYRQPHVAVVMKQRRTIQVRVVGEVETPGVVQIPAAGSDLLAALVAAGGLTQEAGTEIEIRHPNSGQPLADHHGMVHGVTLASFVDSPEDPPRIVRLNLADLRRGDEAVDLSVEDGSVIMVRKRQKHSVSVIGLVRRPDNYELPEDEALRLLDALALAGGPTVSVADKVRVIRHPPEMENPVVIAVSVKRAKRLGKENLVLAPGDIVVVEETPITMAVETVRGFIRFGFNSAIPGL
jgi:polysaccharide export outer membrane protein